MTLEATASHLAGLLDALAWDEVRAVCDELVHDVSINPPAAMDRPLKQILGGLRRKRRFALMERVAEALLMAGLRDPQVVRQYAQALIDQGRFAAAEFALRGLLADPSTPPGERDEARGLLGRLFKQLYVAPGLAGKGGNPAHLTQALAEYWAAYEPNPVTNFWHGINVVALLARAKADGVPTAGTYPPAAELARRVLVSLDAIDSARRADTSKTDQAAPAWEVATRLEAYVALDDYPKALDAAAGYVRAPGADAFELASTERQLREVWRLDQRAGGEGGGLLAVLRGALLSKLGGEVLLDAEAVARTGAALEAMLGDGGLKNLQWFRKGLDCCTAIARIETPGGRGFGTGWMVRGSDLKADWGPDPVLVTNKHVISPPVNDAPYQASPAHTALLPEEASVFFQLPQQRVKVASVLWSSAGLDLDTTIVRLDHVPGGVTTLDVSPRALTVTTPPPLVYIIGHPEGRDLEFSLHDNVLIAVDPRRLHYRAPTDGGSSGSPVFDDEAWRVVALHHAGGRGIPRLDGRGTYDANEGISIGAIRRAVR
jgi:Trypsin-like peptidase domain